MRAFRQWTINFPGPVIRNVIRRNPLLLKIRPTMATITVRLLTRLPLVYLAVFFIHDHYTNHAEPEHTFDHRTACAWLVGVSAAGQILLIQEGNAWFFVRTWFAVGFGYVLFTPFEIQHKAYAIPRLSPPGTAWAIIGMTYCLIRTAQEGRHKWTGCRVQASQPAG